MVNTVAACKNSGLNCFVLHLVAIITVIIKMFRHDGGSISRQFCWLVCISSKGKPRRSICQGLDDGQSRLNSKRGKTVHYVLRTSRRMGKELGWMIGELMATGKGDYWKYLADALKFSFGQLIDHLSQN